MRHIRWITYGTIGALAVLLCFSGKVEATGGYMNQFNQIYQTAGTRLDSCAVCHQSEAGGGALNSYGVDFTAAGHDFADIEQQDSDLDAYENIEEIQALTFPGDKNDYPGAPPPDENDPLPQISKVGKALPEATSGLPILGGTFGGKEGGFVPDPYADDAGTTLEESTKGTTESCTKAGCHSDKPGKPHYANVTPNGDADCWLCHTKHVACTLCHRLGAGESVGSVAAERIYAFTGQDVSAATVPIDEMVAHEAPEANYAVQDGGLIAKDMPGDVSGFAGDAGAIEQGREAPRTNKTIDRLDNTVHDPRFYERVSQE